MYIYVYTYIRIVNKGGYMQINPLPPLMARIQDLSRYLIGPSGRAGGRTGGLAGGRRGGVIWCKSTISPRYLHDWIKQ